MDWRYHVLFFCLVAGDTLAKKPTLRPPHESVEKSQNESYVVACNAGSPDEQVTWEGPGGRPIPAATGRVHVEHRPGLGETLFLDHIVVGDIGKYTCKSSSKDTVSFTLSVVKTSTFKNTPTEHRVNEYQTTIIRCEVEGEPKPLITWQRNNQTLNDHRYVPESKGLKVMNATKNDSGIFTCRALQVGKDDGFIKTVDITLKVQHKPEWKDPVEGNVPVYGYLGGETNLSCEALAQPEATYTWLRNNKDVMSLKLNLTEIQEPGRSVLQLQVLNESVYGQYQCQAKNSLGSISRIFDLQRGEKPFPPTGLRLVQVTVHTATLAVEGGEDGLVGYRFQFVITRPGQEISWSRPEFQDILKTENGQYEIRDLLEDTPYTIRVATRGPAGLSDYSDVTVALRTLKTGEVRSSALLSSGVCFWLMSTLTTLSVVH